MSIGAATRSEFTKHFSTSAWWVLALVMVIYLALLGGGLAAAIGLAQGGQLEGTPDAETLLLGSPTLVYGFAANIGYIFPLILGVLLVTGEFRHGTLVPAFLATPKRGTVLLAKLIAGAVLGAALGVIALIATVGPAAIAFIATDQQAELASTDNLAMFARIVLSFVLWSWIGIGLGSIMRNQVAAIVTALAFTQFVEPTVRLASMFVKPLEPLGSYLPSAASDALVGSNFYGLVGTTTAAPVWWMGAIVLAVYALVLATIGAATTWRRDVN